MAENMITEPVSFWKYLSANRIEIPIIQRDYAQGRSDKVHLRKRFFGSLADALKKSANGSRDMLKLDFVYGAKEKGSHKILPLDGQQRLTTLWLLHWFIAFKADKLEEAAPVLRNFTYETRPSSRDFCHILCDPLKFFGYGIWQKAHPEAKSICDYIRSRTWFHRSWRHDPTIHAMLTALSGSSNNMADGIEKLFDGKSPSFKELYDILISEDAPIVFYNQPLKDFGLTDDLYIKMNARGKPLTRFENFKADLNGFLREKTLTNPDKYPIGEEEIQKWMALTDVRTGVPILMDTEWTDIFWSHKSSKKTIDEIFYAFICRFFWNELFLDYKVEKEGAAGDHIVKAFKYLNDEKENFAKYESFDLFCFIEKVDKEKKTYEISLSALNNLYTVLNNYSQYIKDFGKGERYDAIPISKWITGFSFIPRYKSKGDSSSKASNNVENIGLISRILFSAVCQYFKKGVGNPISLERWMRIVCNLVSGIDMQGNDQIRSIEAVRTAIEFISGLDSHDIYSCLRSISYEERPNATEFDKLIKYEIEKANQRIDSNGELTEYNGGGMLSDSKEYFTWDKAIIDAENWGFFRGCIPFLYHDAEAKVNWDDFHEKWKNARKYFAKEFSDVKETVMNPKYDNAKLMQVLFSQFSSSDFWAFLWWNYRTFNNKFNSWSNYLLHDHVPAAVDAIMKSETGSSEKVIQDDEGGKYLQLLAHGGLLQYTMDKLPDAWIRKYHNHIALYPSSTGVFLNADNRDHFLRHQSCVTIDEHIKVPDSNLLFGTDINFTYRGRKFQWYRNDMIYLMEDADPNSYVRRENFNSAETEEEKYYCFLAKPLTDDEIKVQLEFLLESTAAL